MTVSGMPYASKGKSVNDMAHMVKDFFSAAPNGVSLWNDPDGWHDAGRACLNDRLILTAVPIGALQQASLYGTPDNRLRDSVLHAKLNGLSFRIHPDHFHTVGCRNLYMQ